jgi:serine/threonine-protein kinase
VRGAEEKTKPAVQLLAGQICPRCRYRREEAVLSGLIARCPNDGYALVSAENFAGADGDPFLGTTVCDRFVILGKLGAGSMGTVYRARQEPMGRDVAIKILRADRAFDAHAKARFTREARAMSLLRSPHTVTVFDFGEIPDPGDELSEGASLYLAMEMLEGESLGERLKRVRRFSVEEAARIARHALLSLAEAHEKGIIHRDLKPDNLFLTRTAAEQQEICKVLDFGIAKIRTEHRVDVLETQAGTVFGTPRYMSPEQAQGKPLDARSDLYSLGVLLYQMLVGRPPFNDEEAVVVMARHIKSLPVPPAIAAPEAEIGEALSDLLMRTLAKDPADRPPSAHQLIEDLDRALEQRQKVPPSRKAPEGAVAAGAGEMPALVRDDLDASPARTAGPLSRRSRVAWVIGGTTGGVVLGVLFAFGSFRSGDRPKLRQTELAAAVSQKLAAALSAVAQAGASAYAPEPAPPPDVPSAAAPLGPSPSAAAPTTSESAASSASGVKRSIAPKRPGYKRFE